MLRNLVRAHRVEVSMLLPVWLRTLGCAFAFWIVFLLALEPGNIQHALSMGHAPEFDDEALRIAGAALLGSSTAPLILALIRRFPISGFRSIAMHAAGVAALSFVLIVISCVLAAWVLMGEIIPSLAEIRSQLAGNWLLVTFGLCAFAVIGHALNLFPPRPRESTRIAIKTRGRLGYLDLASIEWIESQGNYLALHAGGRSHLVRETLQNFAGRLDAERFVRVHRRVIVAIDQVREIQPLANGDSTLVLRDGHTIRASRSYREIVRKRWARAAS